MNVKDIIGGNGYLSPSGVEYSEKLGDFIANNIDTENTRFVTSSMNRTRQTAKLAGVSPEQNEDLDEIDAGDFDGLSYGEVKCEFIQRRNRYLRNSTFWPLLLFWNKMSALAQLYDLRKQKKTLRAWHGSL